MPIRVECSSCRCAFRVSDEAEGKRGRCPKCKAPVLITAARSDDLVPLVELDDDDGGRGDLAVANGQPRVAPAVSSFARAATAIKKPLVLSDADLVTQATFTPAEILQSFRDYIEPVRPTPLYRLTVALVAVAMLLLPLIYFSLIVLVAWGVFYHATHHYTIFQGVKGDARLAFFVYFGPIVAGGFLVGFLIKPLFAKSGKGETCRALDPSTEPLLFAFVDGVCSSVGAPSPARVEIDCEVNAAAVVDGGVWGIFRHRPSLRIGLPLVAGLDIKQFAGVLAHEFGHFSQGAGMRVSLLIRSINFWLLRVVYERDSWDEQLEAMCSANNGGWMILGWLVRGVVWATRRVLWCLMMAGHVISGFLMREMEFDADRYQARMVGGEVFESTFRRLPVLGVAMQGAYIDLQQSWREDRLADNLPKLVVANIGQIPPEVMTHLDEETDKAETGLFDTHPCNRDRIFRAHGEDADGVFALDGPASDVFRDFDALCRLATFEFYRQTFGPDGVDKNNLRPVGDVVRSQEVNTAGQAALNRVTQKMFIPIRPFLLPEATPAEPADLKKARDQLISARDRMAATVEDHAAKEVEYDALRVRIADIRAAELMIRSDFKVKPGPFGLRKSDLDSVREADEQVAEEAEAIDTALSVRESALIRRLHSALSLLESDAFSARIESAQSLRDEARALYPVARHVGREVLPQLVEMIHAQQGLFVVLNNLKGNEEKPAIGVAMRRGVRQLRDQIQALSGKLGDSIAYPFEHARDMVSLAQYAVPTIPNADQIGEVIEAGGSAADKIINLHCRLVGRLCLIVEEVEKSLNLDPLPERAEEEKLEQ